MVRQLAKRSGNGLRSTWPSPLSLRQELEDMFHRMWGGDAEWLSDVGTLSLDLSETDEAFQAKVDLPGFTSDDITVQVNGNVLTVSGERKEEKEEKGRTFHRTERSFGSFARSVTLPCEVTENKVSANLEGGVLTIELPKAEKAKPRKVKINS